jgi:hypothetical protein
MTRIKYLFIGPGMVVGAAVLLATQSDSLTATPPPPTVREFYPTAYGLDFTKIYPWTAGTGTPTSSSGAATVSAVADEAHAQAIGALQAANQMGPFAFNMDSLRAFSANRPPPGSNTSTVNYTSMDQWVAGIAGFASSTGAIGFTDNAAAYEPIVGTHAGVLQTANNLGPFVFNLNVLKAIGFTQAPNGAVLPSGLQDDFSAVDIGRWTAGIPGVITNSGTTGFVTSQGYGGGPVADYRIGGIHTTTQIGSMTFDFKFLPSLKTVFLPPAISFSMSPDLTADLTPFGPFTPPPPGVVQPMGGLPDPTAVAPPAPVAAQTAAVSDPAPAVEEAPQARAASVDDNEPEPQIPGVNGVPLDGPRTGGTGASGSNPTNPFKPVTDVIDRIAAFTGNKSTAAGAGTGDGTDGGDSGGDSGGSDNG